MLFRLILVLAIAAGLVLFTLQNMTPTLQLMFLGMQSPALPLSWWVLGAIAAGSLTTLLIGFFFGLSTFVARQVMQSQFRRAMRQETDQPRPPDTRSSRPGKSRNQEEDAAWKDWSGYETPRDRTSDRTSPNAATNAASKAAASSTRRAEPVNDSVDDWERPPQDSWEASDANDASTPSDRPRSSPVSSASKTFQTPGSSRPSARPSARADSSYAYGSQNPGPSGVGRTEKVVDADYRVLVPPVRPLDPVSPPPITPPAVTPPAPAESADDWFEEGNDEFKDK